MVSFAEFQMEDGSPIYLQIMRYLQSGIVAGTVRNGDEMPSRRVLSALLGVNPNTIQKAYRLLEEQGIISSHTGAKSYVTVEESLVRRLRAQLLEDGAAAIVAEMRRMGYSRREALELIGRLWDGAEEGSE